MDARRLISIAAALVGLGLPAFAAAQTPIVLAPGVATSASTSRPAR